MANKSVRSQKIPGIVAFESNDSGITDLDGSQEQGTLGHRTVDTVAEISNIAVGQ